MPSQTTGKLPVIGLKGVSPVKRKRRTKTEIESLEAAIYKLAKELNPCSVRQIYYQCVACGLIEKTELDYKSICRILVSMRRGDRLPYRWLADHTRWRYRPDTHSNLEKMLELTRETYRKSIWIEQARHIEVWLEKSALLGVVLPITDEWDVPLLPTRGYPSLTFLYESAEEIKEIDKPTSIFYFGDYDPSGCHISVKIEEKLRNFAPDVDLSFHRVAVNKSQIAEWELPTRPTKKSDSRSKNFEGESVELDAVPPQQLRALVKLCITRHLDRSLLVRTRRVEELEKQTLENIVKRIDEF